MENIIKELEEKFEKAYRLANEYGEIIGWVSRTSPSSISEEGGLVIFDVEPAIYFKDFIEIASPGSYLAVVDIKTCHIISLNIVSVERRDLLAELDLSDMYISVPNREVSGLLTRTRIKAKPLLAYDTSTDSVFIANYVIEPQSPVIRLKSSRIISKILGLPDNGLFIGYVTTGDRPIFDSKAILYLPLKALYQHVLVLGTTGSGKTTLLKNMISSINNNNSSNRGNITLLIMDPNKDYLTLFLKPTWDFSTLDSDLEKKMIENISSIISKTNGLTIILPLTKYSINNIINTEKNWAKTLKMIAEEYIKTTYIPIAEKYGWIIDLVNIRVAEEPYKTPLRYVEATLEVNYGDSKELNTLYIIPYGFRFTDFTSREFVSLNPYFTRQAKDSLSRLINYLRSMNVYLETIDDLYEILREARYRIYEKTEKTFSKQSRELDKEYIINLIKDLAIHKSTIENIIRQIGSLIDTGLFDIVVDDKSRDKYLQEPPIDMVMENHFKLFKGYPIVVDLEYLQEHSLADPEKVISIVAFRILNKVFEWKLVRTRQRVVTQPVIILFDEAHRFFPSKTSGREDYIEHVSSMIDRIARLGRARRLGLIFSTHSPKDVHDIILQLTNTKIILRMDKTQLSNLDIPSEYRELITRASDRVGIIKSHVLRTGYFTFRTPLPLAGHYDLSILE
ncbi:MAG: DUF87 domain-containing protein [Desulfurococcaceae archaeon]